MTREEHAELFRTLAAYNSEANFFEADADEQRITRLLLLLQEEKRQHLETAKRWIAIERGLQRRIAKARRLARLDGLYDNTQTLVGRMYAALDWRTKR